MPRPATRWTLHGAALALTLVVVLMVERPDDRAAVVRARGASEAPRVAAAATPNAADGLSLQLERLAQRAQRETDADIFNARSWEALAAEEARRNAPPPPPPPPPQAPPLPFTFMGKLVDGSQVTVFLTSGERHWVVRAGDTIEGAYRVAAIGDQKMILTYLALELPQELAIGEAAMPLSPIGTLAASEPLPAPVAPLRAAPLPGEVALLLAVPSRVTAGNELIVSVGLPHGSGARDARLELAFDPKVLAAVSAPSHGDGRVSIALAGATAPLAQVKFRVIAESSTTTRIAIDRATATDARGASLPIAAPGEHSVAIVRPGG